MIKKKLQIDGYNYYYSINESAAAVSDPIIFINGSFQSMKSWGKVVEYFKGKATTILADLPGWGEADALPDHIDFNIHSHAIHQILEAESIGKVNVFSTSFGTPVALAFAKNYDPYISNLVLSSPILETDSSDMILYNEMQALLEKGERGELANFLNHIGLLNDDEGKVGKVNQYDMIKKLFVRQLLNSSEETLSQFASNAKRILNEGKMTMDGIGHIRLLSFTGEHDGFTSGKKCLKAALRFTEGHFTTIKEADHLFLNEQLETACSLIERFFFDNILSDVDGCTEIFSMQDDNYMSKRILKEYENEVKKKPLQPLLEPIEFHLDPERLQASFYTL